MALDFQDAFGLPLFLEPLVFLALADGAVALPTVDAIVGMALLAVCFLRIDVARRFGIARRVLGHRDRIQVLGVHARAVSTGVIDDEAFWNRTVRQPQREAVCLSRGAAETQHPVSVAVLLSRPDQAVTDGRAFRVEACQFGWCGVVHGGNSMGATGQTVAMSIARAA
jgi:hypothetical protein